MDFPLSDVVDFAMLTDPAEHPLAGRESGRPSAGMADFAILEAPGTNRIVPKRSQAEVRSYTPTMRERVAQYLMGDKWSLPRQNFVEGLLGTTGLGETKFNLVDFTPAGSIFGVQEAYRARDPLGMALAVLPAAAPARSVARGTNNVASKTAQIYDPPAKRTRAFTEDYRAGAPADATGRLTHDIEGRPLSPRAYVAGRRVLGGADEALTPEEIRSAATQTLGILPQSVAPQRLGGDAGRLLRFEGPTAGEGRIGIAVDRTLTPGVKDRVVAHEFGHVIHRIAKEIPRRGLKEELEKVYSTLAREGPYREQMKPYVRPEDFGYKPGLPSYNELVAEAIRAYMADPNYLKSVAPKTAAAIRAAVNPNPKLREIIQFNSIAAATAAPLLGALTKDEGESWGPERD